MILYGAGEGSRTPMPLRALDPKSEFGTHRHTFALRNQGFLLVRYVWNRPPSSQNGHKFGHNSRASNLGPVHDSGSVLREASASFWLGCSASR